MSATNIRNATLIAIMVGALGLVVVRQAFGYVWPIWCAPPAVACLWGSDRACGTTAPGNICDPVPLTNNMCWNSPVGLGCFPPSPCIGTCRFGGGVCTAPPAAIACT